MKSQDDAFNKLSAKAAEMMPLAVGKEYESRLKPLHQPKMYSASEWNMRFPIGTSCTRSRDSGGDQVVRTQSTAFYMEGNWSQQGHKVFVEGVNYPVPLERLTPKL